MSDTEKQNNDEIDALLTEKYKNKEPGKQKGRMYFGAPVQEAIVDYNSTDNEAIRNKIYAGQIHFAIDKLAENIINTFKFPYFDVPFIDVQQEVVSFLVMNLHKYDHTKGSKAFSYFSVVAKNYLILHNNSHYKKIFNDFNSNGYINMDKLKKNNIFF